MVPTVIDFMIDFWLKKTFADEQRFFDWRQMKSTVNDKFLRKINTGKRRFTTDIFRHN
jgi:hypothetical protein